LPHFSLQFDYLQHLVSLICGGPMANTQICEKHEKSSNNPPTGVPMRWLASGQ
jgi:hypothetical protein